MNNEFWLPVLTDGLFAAIAAIGFAVISNPPKRAISVVALLGAFGHACRFYLLHYTPLNLTISSLFAAFGIGMLSMLAARLVRCPAEVFSFPALLPMIPGMYAYKTVLALIRFMKSDDVSQSQQLIVEIFRNGLTTLFVMFALVIGVSLAMFIFYKQSFINILKSLSVLTTTDNSPGKDFYRNNESISARKIILFPPQIAHDPTLTDYSFFRRAHAAHKPLIT